MEAIGFKKHYLGVSRNLQIALRVWPTRPKISKWRYADSIGQAAEFKFESKFKPLPTSAGHLAITPEGYSRRQSKDLTAISMAKLLGPRSGSACAGRTGEHKHRAFPSRRQSLRAATGSLEENVLPLLRYWLSSTVKKVLKLCRYWRHIFFIGKWKFKWNQPEVVADQSRAARAHRFAQSCYHSLVSE